MGVHITTDILDSIGMTEQDFLTETAAHLYDIGKMTMGQARNFAGLDPIAFQRELQKREIFVKYDVADLAADLAVMETLED